MRILQITLFVAAALLVAALYFFGNSKAPEKASEIGAPAPGSMQASAVVIPEFSAILAKAKNTLLPEQMKNIEQLESQINNSEKKEEQASQINLLASSWEKTGNILVAGKYYTQEAALTGDNKTLEKAAYLFYMGFPTTADTLAKLFGASEGARAFAEMAKTDSNNSEYLIREAVCNIEGLGNIMEGVVLLKEVERKDPDNEEMNLILGRLAVVSGQYDKAIERLEKLTKRNPENTEAWFHLAEAYRATGKKSEAINSLEQCKKLVNDPAFAAQIDNYIKQIKNH